MLAALWAAPAPLSAAAEEPPPPQDFGIAGGHHYTQASNAAAAGFEVLNDSGAAWWNAYRRFGGPPALGYPIGAPFALHGFDYQPFQRGLLQSSPSAGAPRPANVLEMLDQAGLTAWLRHFRNIPLPRTEDGSSSFDEAVRIREGWLTNDAIRARFENNPDPVRFLTWSHDAALTRWGLPMSMPAKMGPFVAQRFQRAVLQHWVESVEGLPAVGSVTAVFAGDIFAAAGLIPGGARRPVSSAAARAASTGRTAGELLQAQIGSRLAGEPGAWSVVAAPLGSDAPWVLLNPDVVTPSASLWKIAAMLETYRQRRAAGLSLDGMLTMNSSVLERVDPPATLAPGQRISIRAALERMMSVSDNAAAVLLGDRLGYARIDATLRANGAVHTTVASQRPFTTAREIARLLEIGVGARAASWAPPLADVLEMRELLLSEHRNDRIPARLPPGVRVAHKTGDLARSVHDAGVVYASTGPLTLVIMVDETPNYGRSISTAAEIARTVFDAAEQVTAG